jgi:hypothetical protein
VALIWSMTIAFLLGFSGCGATALPVRGAEELWTTCSPGTEAVDKRLVRAAVPGRPATWGAGLGKIGSELSQCFLTEERSPYKWELTVLT